MAQITWNRMLLLIAGGSVDSTAVVLSAFMLGLGLGGKVFGGFAQRSAKPLRVLKFAAVGTALGSLLPLVLEPAMESVYPLFYSSGLQFPARFISAVLMVFPAAFCAGGIIPAASRLVQGSRGRSMASGLYGLNSLGSAIGGFLAGFVLLEAVGTAPTLVMGAALLVAGLVFVRGVRVEPDPVVKGIPPGAFHLVVYAVGGCLALGYETVWSRQLTFVLGNSTYAFSTMGIMVLLGIGLGGWFGRNLAPRVKSPLALFGAIQVLLAVSSVLPLSALRSFGAVAAVTGGNGWAAATAGGFLASFLYMLPSTFLMGVTFPVMLSVCARENRLGEDVGKLTLANCIGAAIGPLLATKIFFLHYGVTNTAMLLAFGSIVTGLACFVRARKFSGLPAGFAAAFAVYFLVVTSRPPGSEPPEGMDLLYFSEDRTATVSVFGREWDGYRSLRINGVEEVPIDQPSLEAFYMLGHLPWGYNPGARTALAVALGGGITSGALLTHSIQSLTCVEICPGVSEALPFFTLENRRPDLDPRFTLVGDDGRNYLLGMRDTFDLIVCDATHPGSSESWLLYTREFYSLVLKRLSASGIAAQWVPLHQLPPREFHRILSTWALVFPHSAAHLAGGRHVILIGGPDSLVLSVEAMFTSSAASEQLGSVAFSMLEPRYLQPVIDSDGMREALSTGPDPNTDHRAYCQFIRRWAPDDPQSSITPNVALLFSFSALSPDPVQMSQMVYWGGSIPGAYSLLNGVQGVMASRWRAVTLTSAAEVLYDGGSLTEAVQFAVRAATADPLWPRPERLIAYIESGLQETE
jgi:spermidine synthase